MKDYGLESHKPFNEDEKCRRDFLFPPDLILQKYGTICLRCFYILKDLLVLIIQSREGYGYCFERNLTSVSQPTLS